MRCRSLVSVGKSSVPAHLWGRPAQELHHPFSWAGITVAKPRIAVERMTPRAMEER